MNTVYYSQLWSGPLQLLMESMKSDVIGYGWKICLAYLHRPPSKGSFAKGDLTSGVSWVLLYLEMKDLR